MKEMDEFVNDNRSVTRYSEHYLLQQTVNGVLRQPIAFFKLHIFEFFKGIARPTDN